MSTYSARLVIGSWAPSGFSPIQFGGYGPGDFLSVESSVELSMQRGADGETVHNIPAGSDGMITVTLQTVSPVNEALSAVWQAQESTGGLSGVGPMIFKDLSGTHQVTANSCRIKKLPTFTRGVETGVNAWVFQAGNIVIRHGTGVVA